MVLLKQRQPVDKTLIDEISQLLDEHCRQCLVKKQIRNEHGATNEQRYCNEVCKVGRQLQEKGRQLNKIDGYMVGCEMTMDEYEVMKLAGHTDLEICEKINISMSTLQRRKKAWGVRVDRSKKREFTREQYEALRAKGYKKRDIEAAWKVKKGYLNEKLKEWGI